MAEKEIYITSLDDPNPSFFESSSVGLVTPGPGKRRAAAEFRTPESVGPARRLLLSTANQEDQGRTACFWQAGSCSWSSPLALPLSNSPSPVSVVRLPALSPTYTPFAVHRKDGRLVDREPLHQIQNSKATISQQYTVISGNSSKSKRYGSHLQAACSKKSKSKPSYQEVGYLVNSQKSSDTSKLLLDKIEERILHHKNLNVRSFFQNGIKNCIEITRRNPDVSNPLLGGPYNAARAVIMEDGVYCFQVHHQKKMTGSLLDKDGHIIATELEAILDCFSSEYRMCHGISAEEYSNLSENIHISVKSKTEHTTPFHRIAHINCQQWFKVGKTTKKLEKTAEARCSECKYLVRYVKRMELENSKKSKEQLNERLKPSSNFSILKLTPKSQAKRLRNSARQRVEMAEKVKKYEQKLHELEVELNEEQNREMEEVVQYISKHEVNTLETLFLEGLDSAEEISDVLRETWNRDVDERQAFFHDQLKNRGNIQKNGYRWSMITYRLALAVFVRSPAAYDALKSFKILQLPSKSSLQMFTSVRNHECGIIAEYIQEKKQEYDLFCKEVTANGRKCPLGLGVIIFDEVKVMAKVMINTKNESFIGLAMTEKEMKGLHDIYANLSSGEPLPAEYVLQFLWRDLSSDFDVIGPYFNLKSTIDHKIVIETVFETMEAFHFFGFKTNALVCDGASSNLAAIKLLCTGKRGAFGTSDNIQDLYAVAPWFANPFDPTITVYCIICPSHQLKNQINALFSSRETGSKLFRSTREGTPFGWKTIQDMWRREHHRIEQNEIRRIHKLLPSYIDRDPWTKLNVAPAKIMQQDNILNELYEYINPEGHQLRPDDWESASLTREYLQACNKIFEMGILSHEKIKSDNRNVLLNIETGFKYFKDWHDSLNGGDFQPLKSTERRFLSWQTWDLLRVMVYGFINFTESFLREHPDYYVVPLKLNGSAVETLFSQFKFETHGKLSSLNYSTARKSVILKKDIHGSTKAARGYRNTALYVRDKVLKRKR